MSGGLSVVQTLSPALLLGVDLNGAEFRTEHKRDRQLQLTLGGSLAVRRDMSVDFAFLAGNTTARAWDSCSA